ncbi:hypothetical protein IFR04_006314 [Cadophora malorum]|uniref:NB-ARC domain-containing protein n=1 Tax=Cadophora malorum TaxID=108018 RepID=A0A8H7TJA4_9HELO|nr:hypothetical protein IFR04_006314 [Cadophora malorum]
MLWAAKRTAKRKEDEAYALLGIFGLHMPMIYGEGRENAFIRLEREIGERSKGANILGNIHWIIPRASNSLFTGRSILLDRIRSVLQSESTCFAQTQRRFVITGLGGQGKSEICLQIASLMKHKFWGIFWVNVDNPSTAERDFIAVAKLLGHSAETIHEARQAFTNTQRSWLLILDNADDPDFDYQVYFPPGNHGAVLMTTRVTECRRYSPYAFEALEGLEEEDSKNLLLKAAEVPRESWSSCGYDAKEVVNLLGSHPLALIQAGAYISQGHCQLGQYPKVYQRQRRRLLKHRPTQAQSRYCDVYATFEASADVLERSQSECASDALRLLEILSMLSSSVLPLQIFEETWKGCKNVSPASDEARGIDGFSQDHVSQLPSFMALKEDEWDSFRLTKATFLLASLSLITRHDFKCYSGLSMHPLTHAWAKDRQDPCRQREVWIISGCVLGFSRLDTRFWQIRERSLLPHVLSYLEIEVKKAFSPGSKAIVTSIFLKCAQALLGMRQDTRLGQLLNAVFIELQQNPIQPSQEFLPIYDLQERSLINLGRNEAAKALLQQILRIREEVLGKTHPDTLTTMSNLAVVFDKQGKYADAEAMNRQTLEISEEVLGKTHPDTLTTMSNLALVFDKQGKYADAEAMNRQTLEIQEEVLGKTHPNTLMSVYCLAHVLQNRCEYDEASILYQRACTGFELSLSFEHPTTEACLKHYSEMLRSLEQTE